MALLITSSVRFVKILSLQLSVMAAFMLFSLHILKVSLGEV